METGKVKLSDTINVGNGILAIGRDTLYDHNWHRGGYGKITVEQGFGLESNIANYKIVRKNKIMVNRSEKERKEEKRKIIENKKETILNRSRFAELLPATLPNTSGS